MCLKSSKIQTFHHDSDFPVVGHHGNSLIIPVSIVTSVSPCALWEMEYQQLLHSGSRLPNVTTVINYDTEIWNLLSGWQTAPMKWAEFHLDTENVNIFNCSNHDKDIYAFFIIHLSLCRLNWPDQGCELAQYYIALKFEASSQNKQLQNTFKLDFKGLDVHTQWAIKEGQSDNCNQMFVSSHKR